MVKIKGNVAGKNFAFMVPDPNIIFHRISKLNFLGSNYSKKIVHTSKLKLPTEKMMKLINFLKMN